MAGNEEIKKDNCAVKALNLILNNLKLRQVERSDGTENTSNETEASKWFKRSTLMFYIQRRSGKRIGCFMKKPAIPLAF